MMDERGGLARWFSVALCLLAASGYLCLRWSSVYNLKTFGARIESDVNLTLARLGVTDHQILQPLHRERSRWGLVWIESSRRIQVQDEADVRRLCAGLVSVAHRKHCFAKQQTTPEGTRVEISFLGMLLQKFWLVPAQTVSKVQPSERAPKAAVVPGQARVAFVIDDVAYDAAPMDRFAELDVPLTFAILPRDPRSKELAKKARSLHFPILLHLPMEPHDRAHNNPGPSALYLGMTPEQLKDQFEKDAASVPGIVGVNNHMGSAFTEDEFKMTLVMQWMKQRKLFFLDSHTTGKSVAPRVARKTGVSCLVNETFLDNRDDAASIERQLDQVRELALRRKQTIAIGHYRRKHLIEALAKKLPEFQARGIAVVPLTAFYRK